MRTCVTQITVQVTVSITCYPWMRSRVSTLSLSRNGDCVVSQASGRRFPGYGCVGDNEFNPAFSVGATAATKAVEGASNARGVWGVGEQALE